MPGRDIWELPSRFVRTREPELVKTEIKKAIEAGEDLPDALVISPSETTFVTVR